jgi:mono/diheme cytochrome c family protein/rhodanese-related sulfurtransferase
VLIAAAAACITGRSSRRPAAGTDGGALAAAAAASGAGAGDAGDGGSALAKLDGPALYASLCAVCHAPDATGYRADNAPSLVNATFLESATDDQLRRSIVEGRPGTSMAAYGAERGGPLDAAAIARLVAWLRSHGPAAPAALPALATRPDGAAGDSARGARLYTADCARCHGPLPDGGTATTAPHLTNAAFLDVANDAFLAFAIARGRPGTPMEPWKGKLSDAQIGDVVAYLRSLAAPPPPGQLPPPTGKEPIVLNPQGKNADFKPRSTPCPPNIACTPDLRFVPAADVKKALDEKRRIVIIDARSQSDWMRVHIPGAVSIPYFEAKRLDEVPNDGTWVVAYCACPHHLSGEIVDALRKRGVGRSVILDEGILEWHRRGYPVVAAPGVTPPSPAPTVSPSTVDAGADASTHR